MILILACQIERIEDKTTQTQEYRLASLLIFRKLNSTNY